MKRLAYVMLMVILVGVILLLALTKPKKETPLVDNPTVQTVQSNIVPVVTAPVSTPQPLPKEKTTGVPAKLSREGIYSQVQISLQSYMSMVESDTIYPQYIQAAKLCTDNPYAGMNVSEGYAEESHYSDCQNQNTLFAQLQSKYNSYLQSQETKTCDLNTDITTDSDRTFCHSLFKNPNQFNLN